jgi:hypothetical protein
MACSNDCCILNPEELVKCPNFLLCESYELQDVLDDNNGLCLYCCVMNDKLEFELEKNCILCLENNKIGICFDKKCDHHICIECYKKKYMFGNDEDENNIFKKCAICNKK